MKKLYISLLFLSFAIGSKAQTINAGNHTPLNGEMFTVKPCDPLSVSVGPNGASVNWNFNSLLTLTNAVISYTSATGSYSLWPSASVAVSSATNDMALYSGSATELKYWGGNLVLGGAPALLQFSNPAYFMLYPTTLNTGTVSNIAGTVTALGNNGNFIGTCTSTALATGSMSLPSATLTDVIRVNQSIAINFTISGFPGTATRNLYDFYSKSNSKYPILTIDQSTITSGLGTSTQNAVYVQTPYIPAGVKEVNAEVTTKIHVFPNPTSEILHIICEGITAKEVFIYDVTGKQIEDHLMNNGTFNLNTSNYSNGLYIYKIIDTNNRPIKTGRVTVIH